MSFRWRLWRSGRSLRSEAGNLRLRSGETQSCHLCHLCHLCHHLWQKSLCIICHPWSRKLEAEIRWDAICHLCQLYHLCQLCHLCQLYHLCHLCHLCHLWYISFVTREVGNIRLRFGETQTTCYLSLTWHDIFPVIICNIIIICPLSANIFQLRAEFEARGEEERKKIEKEFTDRGDVARERGFSFQLLSKYISRTFQGRSSARTWSTWRASPCSPTLRARSSATSSSSSPGTSTTRRGRGGRGLASMCGATSWPTIATRQLQLLWTVIRLSSVFSINWLIWLLCGETISMVHAQSIAILHQLLANCNIVDPHSSI